MQPFRLTLASFAVVALLVAGACKTVGPWDHPPNSPLGEDLKQYSVKESIEFYRNFYPARGYYVIIAVPEGTDPGTKLNAYSFVVFRISEAPRDGGERVKLPLVERIIGPVRTKDDWVDLFSVFRRYSSSPPAGYYCWQNDCRGKYNPPGEPDPRDPYPPDLPGQPPTSLAGYAVVPVDGADGGMVLLEEDIERARQLALNGTGGSQAFEPRDGTRITPEYINMLRGYVEGI
ncbi:MAG: hypothetical protein EHM78_27175, partial [Myxococcaceae bacterium]